MFKSFTGRFFTIYALTTFVMFLLLFGVFTQVITNHFVEGTYLAMVNESAEISDSYIDAYMTDVSSDISFIYQIQAIGRHIDARILIVNKEGTIIKDSIPGPDSLLEQPLNEPLLDRVFADEIVKESSTFGGTQEQLVLTTGYPIHHNGEIIAAVMMNTPFPSLKQDIDYIYQLTLISLVVILVVTFLSTYVFSKGISKTITELSSSVTKIANGDFTSRVQLDADGELGQLAGSMNHMASELEKLEDMRKDFIANISHDFRSPLTSIKGFVQAMLDDTIPYERQDKYLQIVLDETERLTKLTNDILLLTKMENNTIQLSKTHFDLHQCIRKILLQFEQKIIDKKIDFTLLIDQHELFVHADMNQIQRVIANLIDNAIKFCSPHDDIIVETTIKKDKVEISIKDSGPGISEEDIKYIWDRFHKADRSRGKDKKGIGLGLSIVREIVKAHDEDINVYSQEGKGTTFVFTLTVSHQS